jgi:hypothetical protein
VDTSIFGGEPSAREPQPLQSPTCLHYSLSSPPRANTRHQPPASGLRPSPKLILYHVIGLSQTRYPRVMEEVSLDDARPEDLPFELSMFVSQHEPPTPRSNPTVRSKLRSSCDACGQAKVCFSFLPTLWVAGTTILTWPSQGQMRSRPTSLCARRLSGN